MLEIIASSAEDARDGYDLQKAMKWFDLSPEDRDRTMQLGEISESVAEAIIEAFYEHLLSDPVAAQHFHGPDHVEKVKAGQLRYFRELISAELDDDYIADRRRIGGIHERTGVTPTLYIGAYAFYLNRLATIVLDRMKEEPDSAFPLLLSLFKFAHFDMALALETYVDTREETIRDRERELSELPTPVLQLRPGLLLIPVVGTLDSFRARALTVQLLEGIRAHRARAVVLDITGVAAVDSAVANHLIQTMSAARLMGVRSVLTGLSAEVAQSLVKVGVTAEKLQTAGDLESGIELADRLMAG
ncbi:protoglobin domain-containing protein [Epibacterium sp. Ofav1-8]|uniref:protoglobin domain-containing protein n=1 Tax=Epibacterium sp. Ofav1-8 TaxID=2917735 RepID=UPI001EF60A06|nr:protoglobin domain-containing protein [Epibacterium sp. Ofav1-8]MCG7622280.1 protoglobin domain-containing protein [Epibacterium sp. Ofav1-8]